MNTILVTTDFSASSRNTLAYACGLFGNEAFTILLLHAYAMPVTYTTEGVALAAMGDAFINAEEQLQEEKQWAVDNFPGVQVRTKAVVATMMDALRDEIEATAPQLILIGALTDYDDLWTWDNDLLSTLQDLDAPVLVVPGHVTYQPLRNIGFACDYKNRNAAQIRFIKWLVEYTGARLHVVHITRGNPHDPKARQENEALMQELLLEVNPDYHNIEDPHVIPAISGFAKDYNLDLLIVIPHRYGIWDTIFKQSHTRRLARLNYLPMLALHD
ncbi:universal stress protein [Taibaiella chishuiensis]|uniref:Universal stress protein family protein n=1 Tax=Taibaiella chishuiensis TaxID=1434707 RepID=A0A2P8D1D4_9BACT|nr:universal stress protein [Taibaiella chishuiensis]PSK91022.1 universal stress protein family protein [Taibaiella chishuiensis]